MAYSTQKEFFHVPFMNETIKFECRKECVKLKSYESTVDDRSWALNESAKSRFFTDLLNCRTTGIGSEEDSSEFTDEDEVNSFDEHETYEENEEHKDKRKSDAAGKENIKYEKRKGEHGSRQRRREADKNVIGLNREGSDRILARRTNEDGREDVTSTRRGNGERVSRKRRDLDEEGGSRGKRYGDIDGIGSSEEDGGLGRRDDITDGSAPDSREIRDSDKEGSGRDREGGRKEKFYGASDGRGRDIDDGGRRVRDGDKDGTASDGLKRKRDRETNNDYDGSKARLELNKEGAGKKMYGSEEFDRNAADKKADKRTNKSSSADGTQKLKMKSSDSDNIAASGQSESDDIKSRKDGITVNGPPSRVQTHAAKLRTQKLKMKSSDSDNIAASGQSESDDIKSRKDGITVNGPPSRVQTHAAKRGLADGSESNEMIAKIKKGIYNSRGDSVFGSKMINEGRGRSLKKNKTEVYTADSSGGGRIADEKPDIRYDTEDSKRIGSSGTLGTYNSKLSDADATQTTADNTKYKRPEGIAEAYAPDGTHIGTIVGSADDNLGLYSGSKAAAPQSAKYQYDIFDSNEMGLQSDGSLIYVANRAMARMEDILLKKNNLEKILGDVNKRLNDTAQERDELRDRLRSFKEMEWKIDELKRLAANAGKDTEVLKGSICDQTKYIQDMEHEFLKTEDYYEEKLQNMEKCKQDAQHMVTCLKVELQKMRREAVLVEPLQRQNSEMNQQIVKLKSALDEYDFMYKQLLSKVEIFKNQGYSFDVHRPTTACTCTCSLSDGTSYSESTDF